MVITQKDIVARGRNLFYKIKDSLGEKYDPGHYVTIEVETGKFFVGNSPIQAINKAKKSFPRRQFFLAQVGKMAGALK